MLEPFGLDAATEAVYLQLLRRPHLSAVGVARLLQQSEDKVREAIDILERLSLLQRSALEPDRLRPVPPAAGLEVLLARQRVEVVRSQQRIEEARAALEVLATDHAKHHASAEGRVLGGEEIHGAVSVRRKLERMVQAARHALWFFDMGGAPALGAFGFHELFSHPRCHDVDVRVVCLAGGRSWGEEGASYPEWPAGQRVQVRTVPMLPAHLLIIDRSCAVVAADPDDASEGMVVYRGPGLVAALCALFDQVWEDAAGMVTRSGREAAQELTAQEMSLLRLLLHVNTDEQAARRMGVSPRTVGRLTSGLMTRLGASNRFQAGVRAVERGWL